jgi:hypothetical protein
VEKTSDKILLTLPRFMRKEVKKAATRAHLTESALIREAIKFYLRERADDPLFYLQPKEKEISTLSKQEQAQLLLTLQTFNLVQKLSKPEDIQKAAQWAGEMAAKLEDM